MTPDRIFEVVEHFTGYTLEDLCWRLGKYPPVTRARFLAMWLLHTELGLRPQAIATLLCRDRKLVSYGVRKVDSLVMAGNVETVRVLVCARLRLRERERMVA